MGVNKYKIIHEISEVIARTPDSIGGLNKVTEILYERMDNSVCALFAYNANTGMVSLVAAHGICESQVGKLSFNVSEGLTGMVIRTGKVLNVNDQEAYRDNIEIPADIKEPGRYGKLHGLCIAPLELGGSVIGAITLARTAKRQFSKTILETLQEIAPALAMFITNSLLMQKNASKADAFSLQSQRPNKIQQANKPFKGRPITKGLVYGHAIILSCADDLLSIKRMPAPAYTTREQINKEIEFYQESVEIAKKTCQRTAKEMAQTIAEADCEIFEMHAMLLDDPSLKQVIMKYLEGGHTLDTALAGALRTFSAKYQKIEDEYMRERLSDIKDVLLNIKNAADNISKKPQAAQQNEELFSGYRRNIVIARDLLPSQLVALPLKKVTGIVLEDGGTTSHVAILARALQMPMVVGVSWLKEIVNPGDSIILDANLGNCFIRPTLETLHQFGPSIKAYHEQQENEKNGIIQPEAEKQAQTKDGVSINLAGNFALLSELPMMKHYGVKEIGLYRTEFMFMIRYALPDEEEQFTVLKRLVDASEGRPVTIRVLDAGGDKQLPYMNTWDNEDNPALGCRGLRFMLANPDLMKTHLRALLRATAYGNVNILLPMVADLFDFMAVKDAIAETEKELRAEGIAVSDSYKLGVMLEIPSLFHVLEIIIPHIDFISIGTNDLVQFLFAVDRGNPAVTRWYKQCHPVVLRIIRDTCSLAARYPGKRVCLCGELAGSKRALPLLLGAGLRNFSLTPSRIPMLKEQLAKYDIPWCEKLLREVLDTCGSELDIMNLLASYGINS